MGVYERRRKGGTVYWINFVDQTGKQRQERGGTDRAAANRLLSQRRREVRDGTYVHANRSGAVTVASYADTWGAKRKNASASDDRQRLRDHVVPALGVRRLNDLTPADVFKFATSLKESCASRKTAKNVYGVFRTMVNTAFLEGLIPTDPCALPKRFWGRVAKRERAPYKRDEVLRLTRHQDVPHDTRVWNAVAFYGGLREGEICGLTIGDWDRDATPLGALSVDKQYAGKPLKTDRPRRVPVHPDLAAILDEWVREGFAVVHRRAARSTDPLVPQRVRGGAHPLALKHHSKSSAYKAFQRACAKADVEAHTLHSTRHTMVTWARRGRAPEDVLEVITHNAAGKIIDQYTHWHWEPLCEAVLCLRYDPEPPRLVYDAGYDASAETAEIPRENGGGAGNRTQTPAPESSGIDGKGADEPPSPGAPFPAEIREGDRIHVARHTQLAVLFLRACGAGAPCDDLALALARAVLDAPLVALARAVLDDGDHRFARATELADAILAAAASERGRRRAL